MVGLETPLAALHVSFILKFYIEINYTHRQKLYINILETHIRLMSRVMRKPTFYYLTWSDTNQAVQLQKMVRGLKFRI